MKAKLVQFGLLGLMLLAVGAQVPQASSYRQAAGLLSLPIRSVHTDSEGTIPDLLNGASRVKSIPKPDTSFALFASQRIPVRPGSSDLLAGGIAPILLYAHSYAHSGRAPPSI